MWSTADTLQMDVDNTVGYQCGNVVGARRRNHGNLQGHNTVGSILGGCGVNAGETIVKRNGKHGRITMET